MKAQKSNRPPLARRPFRLVSEEVRERIIAALRHLPLDPLRPIEVVFQEEQKKRKPDQNALMWAGPLKEISEQAWLDGQQFSAETWHVYFRRQLLPEEYDPELCMEGYQKWAIDPSGDRILVGSTTQLTQRGMSFYVEGIIAFGATLGVQYRAWGEM